MGGSLKLGILGGTFDPVHLAHLRMALEAAEDLDLDRVDLVPAAVPPHKAGRAVASFDDRVAMIRLAVEDTPRLGVLDLEGRRRGASYTILTLQDLHSRHAGDLDLYFVLGADAFLDIATWKDHRSLFDYAHFVLMERPGVPQDRLERFLESPDLGLERIGPDTYRMPDSGHRLIRRKGTAMDISSSRIRKAVAGGRSVRFLVPRAVETYILEKGLYRFDGESR